MLDRSPPTAPRLRLLLKLVAYDLMNTALVTFFWIVVIRAADPWVLFGLWVIRGIVLAVYANAVFEPLQRWATHESDIADHGLLELDRALARGRRRFVRAYMLGWLLTLLGSTAFAAIGVPVAMPLGLAEIVTAIMVATALALGVAPVLQALLEGGLNPTQTAIARRLAARRLGSHRPRTTVVSTMLAQHLPATLSVFIGVTALGGMVRVQGLRALERTEQQRRAELGAQAQRLADGPLETGLTLVEGHELPAILHAADAAAAANDLQTGETLAAAPVGDGRWVVARAPTDESFGPFVAFLLTLLVVIAGTQLIINVVVSRSLATKLRELRNATRRVVEDGEIRTIERVVALDNDEVGLLVHDFNEMLDVFEELACAASRVASGDLRVELERPGDLHDAFRSMVARLGEMVVEIRTTAVELASAAAQIHQVTRAHEQATERQSASVREVGSTAASLALAAREIAASASLVLDNADRSRETTDHMVAKIAELTREANGVAALLEVIRDVADRSDLLALNGSLEATRAGEAGRGFALVAAEMRRLAERVNSAVTDVREHVASIARAGTSTVLATEEAKKLVETTAVAAQQISEVTVQQSRDTDQVSQAIEDVTHGAIATATAMAETRAAAEQLELEAERLERLTRRFELRLSPTPALE